MSENPHLKPCSVPNCKGHIDTKSNIKKCSKCGKKHCAKCLKVFHNGVCIADEHDVAMKSAQCQKCPACGIWVQKNEGCDYIDCKCGKQFCFRCGMPFAEDPCRKR